MSESVVDRSGLVGREHDVATVLGMLETSRVLTLCGPGGVGKTRLAREVGRRLESVRAMPVCFVDLSNVIDAEDAGETIGRAVDACSIQQGRSLVVLDNCEHLLEPVRDAVELAVQSHASLRVLMTSRVPVDAILEATYRVQPLALEAARALFVRRVLAFDPKYDPQPDGADIESICTRLEGLPLALELAAPRVRVLGARRLAERLSMPYQLLSGRPEAGRPPRQQSLRALIAWSFDLLDEHERRAMQQLSVFAGWFSLEAAREVCSEDVATASVTTILALREKSLLAHDGERYYRMLEPIREFAAEKLRASGETGVFARRGHQRLQAATQGDVVRRLDAFHDNVRAALAWSLEYANDVELGAELVLAYTQFWIVRGFLTEGRRWVDRAASRLPPDDSLRHARLARAAGKLARQQGALQTATEANRRAVAFYESRPESAEALADALNGLALALHESAVLDEAERTYERALDIERQIGDDLGVAITSNNLAGLLVARGDFAPARARFETCLAHFRAAGDARMCGLVLANLAELTICCDQPAEALPLAREAYGLRKKLGDRSGMAHAALRAAEASILAAYIDDGRAYLKESLELAEGLENTALTCDGLRIATLLAVRTSLPEVAISIAAVEAGRRRVTDDLLTPVRRARHAALLAQARAQAAAPRAEEPHGDLRADLRALLLVG